MSGICAVWRKQDPERLGLTLSMVNAGLALTAGERPHQETAHSVGVAVHARFPASQQIFRNGRVMLACDAELVNENELRGLVELTSHESTTAAVLAALFERYGDQFVDRLRGGFSVVVWDLLERRLLAAVDAFGIKRLAWYDDGKLLLIASRVDAVAAGTDGLRINPRAIVNVVNFAANLSPETIFAGVQRLGPGRLLRASAATTRTVSYWDMCYNVGDDHNEARLSRELEVMVQRSVAAHCGRETASDLGAFLSGGTDSSTVLGMMTRTLQTPVNAFSIGFQEQRFNELEYAEIAASAFASKHHTYLVSAKDCHDALSGIIRCFDEPFGNASAIPTYFCARLAADNGARTLLAGDGGDELFGGNERYATEKIFEAYHSVPQWLRGAVIEPLVALPIENSLIRRGRGYIRRAHMPGVERMFSFSFLRTHTPAEVFHPDFLRSLGGYNILDIPAHHYGEARASDHLDRLLYVDLKITIADNDLPKVTRVSELAGVQTRFPLLDREVAEFSGRIPARLKVKGLRKRYLFKRAFRNLLPAEIIKKKKHGFGIPVASWIRSDPQIRELTRDTLLSSRLCGRGYFRRQFVEELFRRHEATDATYYGDILWTLLMVELWHQQFTDKPARVVA